VGGGGAGLDNPALHLHPVPRVVLVAVCLGLTLGKELPLDLGAHIGGRRLDTCEWNVFFEVNLWRICCYRKIKICSRRSSYGDLVLVPPVAHWLFPAILVR